MKILMEHRRKLFCEISPLTYKISVFKCRTLRRIKDALSFNRFALKKTSESLPVLIYSHKSLMRRKLGNTEMQLQENKVVNLNIAAPKVTGVLIYPGETFSFWKLVGCYSEKEGYKEGLTISNGKTSKGIGGGLCQFTNLIHWMVLHTPLQIVEHHHHGGMDLFPDFGRQIPFGTGTSVVYNYIDYRFKNNTNKIFQLIVYTTDEYLCGELRCSEPLDIKYHIKSENDRFVKIDDVVYRKGEVFRECIDKVTGNVISKDLIKSNFARVMYDTSNLVISDD